MGKWEDGRMGGEAGQWTASGWMGHWEEGSGEGEKVGEQ